MKRIKTVETVEEAQLLISMLESCEIPCELTNDYIVAVDPLMSNAVHGIDILVDDEYAEDAGTIIGTLEEDKGKKHCPHCNSAKIRYLRLNWWNLLFIFKGFILPVGRKRMFCMNCLKKFEENEIVEAGDENDELTKEALSHPFEDREPRPVPNYLVLIGAMTLIGIFFGVYSDLHYSKFKQLPLNDFFIFVIVLGGIGFILYSLFDPSAKDNSKKDENE